jgi:hypothetical protein
MIRALNTLFGRLGRQLIGMVNTVEREIEYTVEMRRIAANNNSLFAVAVTVDGRTCEMELPYEEAARMLSYTNSRLSQICGAYNRVRNVNNDSAAIVWNGALSW